MRWVSYTIPHNEKRRYSPTGRVQAPTALHGENEGTPSRRRRFSGVPLSSDNTKSTTVGAAVSAEFCVTTNSKATKFKLTLAPGTKFVIAPS